MSKTLMQTVQRGSHDVIPVYRASGQGPNVLFIHGAAGDGDIFAGVEARLRDRFTTVVYNRQGFDGGLPSPEQGDAYFREHGAAAAGILRQLAAPTHLVGCSSGGLVALEAARQLPELVASLTLIEVPWKAAEISRALGFGESYTSGAFKYMLGAVVGSMWGNKGYAVAQWLRLVSSRRDGTNGYDRLDGAQQAHLAKYPEASLREFAAVGAVHFTPSLASTACTPHFLLGTQSRALTQRMTEELAGHWPQAQVHSIADADHFAPLDNPDAVASTLRDCLGR